MNKRNDEAFFKELFSREMEISSSTEDRIAQTYSLITKNGKAMRKRHNEKKRAFFRHIACAAAMLILLLSSAGVLAYETPNWRFLQSVFGNIGLESTEQHPYKFDPELMLPGNERVTVDDEIAERLVGEYITPLDKQVDMLGYSFIVENLLIDENGIGYITYKVENPNGLDALVETDYHAICYTLHDDVGVCDPDLAVNGQLLFSCYSYIDSTRSSDTSAYLIMTVTPFTKITTADELSIHFSGFEKDIDDALPDEDELYIEKSLILPSNAFLPATVFSDSSGAVKAEVSAVGIQLTYNNETTLSNSPIRHRLSVLYENGDRYTVFDRDKNFENYWSGSEFDNRESYIFNRMVNTSAIETIQLDNLILTRKDKNNE